MRQPTAPMLQAEYHNYNEQASFNDYYGGYEPKDRTWNGNGPRRVDIVVEKNRSVCQEGGTGWVHALNAVIVCRALFVIALIVLCYYSGIRHNILYFIAIFEAVNILASFLMCCGIENRQPFACILFTVIRTMETFVALVIAIGFGWAVFVPKSDAAQFVKDVVRESAKHVPQLKDVDLLDLAWQISVILFIFSLLIVALCLAALRISWTATLRAADERRSISAATKHEVSRVMVASDELYTNY